MICSVANRNDRGFVLVTALIMLSLLTLMSLAMFYASRSATQTSATAQSTTEAYYYAETAVHYISWGLINDAEFDSFSYTGTYQAAPFAEAKIPVILPSGNSGNISGAAVGDWSELTAYLWNPGPNGVAGSSANDTSSSYITGQLKYFDNSPLNSRAICFQDVTMYSNCIDVTVVPANRVEPIMENISTKLPRYIKLEITSTGVVTPSIPSLPHRPPPIGPIVGEDIPRNGAIVWLTAVNSSIDPNKDIEIFPLDPSGGFGLNGEFSPATCPGGTPACPCPATIPPNAGACDATKTPTVTGKWISSYGIAIYAIGYVNGKPSHLLRAIM